MVSILSLISNSSCPLYGVFFLFFYFLFFLFYFLFFCAAIKRDSVSPLKFSLLCHIQVFSREISWVCRLKYPYSCLSSHFGFLVVVLIIILSVLILVAVIIIIIIIIIIIVVVIIIIFTFYEFFAPVLTGFFFHCNPWDCKSHQVSRPILRIQLI